MPIVTVWDNPEKTIIRKDFQVPWDWDDYAAALDESNVMMAKYPERQIGIILNLAAIRNLPPHPLVELRRVLRGGMPDNWQGTVIVGGGLFVASIAGIAKQGFKTLHRQVQTARTLNEARQMLAAPQDHEANC